MNMTIFEITIISFTYGLGVLSMGGIGYLVFSFIKERRNKK